MKVRFGSTEVSPGGGAAAGQLRSLPAGSCPEAVQGLGAGEVGACLDAVRQVSGS